MNSYWEWWSVFDALANGLLVPLVLWILLSGIDDLFVDAVALCARVRSWRRRGVPARRELLRLPQLRIAVFVPCWQEDAVIARMVERNLQRIAYTSYDIFIGVYPNDSETVRVVEDLERRHSNVHAALCPHPGPTSKADCLNWIYQRMLLHEEAVGIRYEVVVTHDAEDVIHPDSLHWISFYSANNEMVQVPVLPLPTPVTYWTHGVYCDEFAEYQSRDMPAREFMGAFVPSAGVGTGFRRTALEQLAAAEGNRIFEPVCLTEDYENGYRLRKYGGRQRFVPLVYDGVATREFFPQTFRTAVRQRTRWITGIVLQTWNRHGWSGSAVQRYWLWRDRKGLIGNPASLLTNLLVIYQAVAALLGFPRAAMPEPWRSILNATALLCFYRIVYRAYWSSAHYGWMFAPTIFIRIVWANLINTFASIRAIRHFLSSVLSGEPLVWVKTEHQYPSAAALQTNRWRIGEVLVRNGYVDALAVRSALAGKPEEVRTGEYLVSIGALDEDSLYEALSLQHGIPQRRLEASEVRAKVARALPFKVSAQWKVVPFKVEPGTMLVAGPELPTAESEQALGVYTNLRLRFHLITPTNYEELVSALL